MEAAGEPECAAARERRGDKRRPQARRRVKDGRGPHADDGAANERKVGHAPHEITRMMIAPARARQPGEKHYSRKEGAQFAMLSRLKLLQGRADGRASTAARHFCLVNHASAKAVCR